MRETRAGHGIDGSITCHHSPTHVASGGDHSAETHLAFQNCWSWGAEWRKAHELTKSLDGEVTGIDRAARFDPETAQRCDWSGQTPQRSHSKRLRSISFTRLTRLKEGGTSEARVTTAALLARPRAFWNFASPLLGPISVAFRPGRQWYAFCCICSSLRLPPPHAHIWLPRKSA